MALWTPLIDYILDQALGFQDVNEIKNTVLALASARLRGTFGGSRQISVPQVAAAQDAIDYRDVEIDGTQLAGLTVRARVEVRVANGATSVTPKIRNVTDSTDAVTGAACSATTFAGANGTQTLTFTPTTGIKKYRLQLTPSNTTHPAFGIAELEIFAIS